MNISHPPSLSEAAQLSAAFDTIEGDLAVDPENARRQHLIGMLVDIRTQMGGMLAPELDEGTQQQFQQWNAEVLTLGGAGEPMERLRLILRVAKAMAAGSAPLSVPPESLAASACLAAREIWSRFENHNSCGKRGRRSKSQATALAQLIETVLPYLPDGDERQSVAEKATMLRRIAQGEAISAVLEDVLGEREGVPA